jgi:hypothetical protein
MLGHDPDEDPDAAVDSLREQLAPEATRSPSTLLARQTALEDVSPAVRATDDYPTLLAAVVEVLRAEARSDGSEAASLFGMRATSRTVQRRCVRELGWFDLDGRLESATQHAADDRLLQALVAVVHDGDDLPEGDVLGSSGDRSPADPSLPMPVAVALDHLLFVSPADRVRRHATELTGARRTVSGRVLATDPDAVARTDARIASVLATQPALDAPDRSRLEALVEHLTAASDPVVRAWGCSVVASHDDAEPGSGIPTPVALVDAVHAAVDDEHAREAAWMLGRAAATTTVSDRRARYVDVLCSLTLDADDVHGPVLEVLRRLAAADALAERDAPMLFESARDGLTATHDGARRPAAKLVDALLAHDVVPAAFLDRTIASLGGDATTDDPAAVRGALGGIRRLFETEFESWALKHPAIVAALEPPARRRLLDATATVLLDRDDETVTDAARALRDVAHAAPDGDPAVLATADNLLDTAIDDTGDARTRACTAIAQSLPWRVLSKSQAERFLTAQTPAALVASPAAIRAADGILSKFDVADALDLDAYSDALVDRIPDVQPDGIHPVVRALETLAEERDFDDPVDGIEFLAAAADALARIYRTGPLRPTPTDYIERIVDAVPSPGSTTALAPLVDRLQADDTHARRAVVDVLGFATPDDDAFLQTNVDPDDPLLTGGLVHPFVRPLVVHVTRGDVEDGLLGGTLSLLGKYAARGWLTDAQLGAVANLALELLDDHPGPATDVLDVPAIAERLAGVDVHRILQRYAAALEPPDRDPSDIIITDADDDVPSGTLDVLSTLLETELVTPAAFLDAVPIRELGAEDAPSISRLITAPSPPTAKLLGLLEWASERCDRSLAPLARPLEEALATTDLGARDHLTVLALRTGLDATARFGQQ